MYNNNQNINKKRYTDTRTVNEYDATTWPDFFDSDWHLKQAIFK